MYQVFPTSGRADLGVMEGVVKVDIIVEFVVVGGTSRRITVFLERWDWLGEELSELPTPGMLEVRGAPEVEEDWSDDPGGFEGRPCEGEGGREEGEAGGGMKTGVNHFPSLLDFTISLPSRLLTMRFRSPVRVLTFGKLAMIVVAMEGPVGPPTIWERR